MTPGLAPEGSILFVYVSSTGAKIRDARPTLESALDLGAMCSRLRHRTQQRVEVGPPLGSAHNSGSDFSGDVGTYYSMCIIVVCMSAIPRLVVCWPVGL